MASLGTLRFIQGFTGDVRNSIEKRDEAERERKKMTMLEELRRNTFKWEQDYKAILDKRKSDKDLTQVDYEKGIKVLKNSEGETIREVPLSKSEMDEYRIQRRGLEAQTSERETKAKFAEREALSNLAKDAASIRAADASAASSRASAGLTARQARALDQSDKGSNSLEDRANELAFRQKAVVEDLIASNVPAELVMQTAIRSVKESAAREGTISPETIFLRAANVLRQQAISQSSNTAIAKPPKL